MKNFLVILILLVFIGCQPEPDNTANETFKKNSETVMAYLEGFQNESLDYAALYSSDVVLRGTAYGAKDSFNLEDIKSNDIESWEMFDFELMADTVNLLPGVNPDTKMADGSVRYYGDWKVTLPATDSTESKSGIIKLYESFDFDEEGKILYQQYYGDATGLFMYLTSN